ncbi:MAG: hypothetical protein PHF60_05475 [Candidatus ainarchaeum sp.]|nr:hypothetical protein [Candidatus ainarchaeum sp.]
MFPAFLGQFKAALKEKEEPEQTQKPPEQQKSPSADEFVKTPEVKQFVDKWTAKPKEGKPAYTKRGVVELVRYMHQIAGLESNKAVLAASEGVLKKLSNMDGLHGFLMGMKIKPEGLLKGLGKLMGSK